MKRRDLAREISKWLETVGLTEWANRKVEELSKGMQQKLQFVATVLADPEILILDEPFSGLDPVNLDLLKGIILGMHDAGKTVLFSTHIMEQAEKLCDYILLINKGKKVLDGTLDQIRSRYEANAVSAELEGDTSFISDLPMVKSLSLNGKRLEISLKEQGDSQELLRALVGRVRVRAFEVKVPSLHEIFVHLVGENNE
jgi:ABC-2 type transport system ATP-binding protein